MARRNPANNICLVKMQYERLKDAVDAFYNGRELQALNIATTLRVLVHQTPRCAALLSRLKPDYWDLTIHDRPLSPKTAFRTPFPLQICGDGTKGILRPIFNMEGYERVSLRHWWDDEYMPLGTFRLSKKTIILNVADKDGGAHVDSELPDHYVTLVAPPFVFVMDNGGEQISMQPNMAYGITAHAGSEMQEFLEHHFPEVR